MPAVSVQATFCANDPVNNVDPLGLEAYVVYRQFYDEDKREDFPDRGHFFLAFDEKGVTDLAQWRKMVERLGKDGPKGPQAVIEDDSFDPDAETFSFHPWEVYDSVFGKEYNLLSIAVTEASYIGYGDRVDRLAFRRARDNASDPEALNAMVFPLRLPQEQQFELYRNAIASRNINNLSPTSMDIGAYSVGMKNCGTWVHWMIEESGFKFPSKAQEYNRVPYLGGIPILGRLFAGAGIGGTADYLLVPQLGTLAAGTVGYGWRGTKAAGFGVAYGSAYIGTTVWQGAATIGQGVVGVVKRGEYSIGIPSDWDMGRHLQEGSAFPLLTGQWRF
jgi:hypothetical protein